jgi:hypothetical protein
MSPSPSQPRRLSIDRIDKLITDPDSDLAGLALGLGLPVAQVEAFARVRRTLLARRTFDGGTDLTVAYLRAAGITVTDVSASLAIAKHVHQLRAAQQRQADRFPARTRPQAQRCTDDRAVR